MATEMRRRGFLASALATVAAPAWAALDTPRFLSAAADASGRTWIVGLSAQGESLFRVRVPARGHAAAAHPQRAEAVAFARRPGDFAVILDCTSGQELARLTAPAGHHFYGHGAFSADGSLLLTTENAFETGEGRIGLWDASRGYARIGDLPSGGIGPHDIIRLREGGFAVANGGIKTHPDFGRRKLNLPRMRTNLSYLSPEGHLIETVEPPKALRQNSIRHLAQDSADRIVIATQWQGKPVQSVPLMASHRRGERIVFHDHPGMAGLKHYAGSVACGPDKHVLVTGPKGGRVLLFEGDSLTPAGALDLPEASGVAASGGGFVVTTGEGVISVSPKGETRAVSPSEGLIWDNHLIPI